jgi:methylenetetrahydrofolate reductase (NADPH)
LRDEMSKLSEKVAEGNEFIVTCEFVPGRGSQGQAVDEAVKFGEKVAASKLPVHAISITDNPGGNPAISPDVIAEELKAINVETLVHVSCAGLNRNTFESRLSALARKGMDNVLVVSGDYPVGGYGGRAKPVFDLDSVQAIRHVKAMNAGIEVPGKGKDGPVRLPQTKFFVACGVSPFGKTDAEYVPQMLKLEKKIKSGVDLVIPQLGYDARKFAEIQKFLRHRRLNVPVLGNCYVLSRPVARLMNKGEVPGCVVTDELLKVIEAEAAAPDKGKGARLDRAAKLTAVFRGLKFRGVHIGGFGLKFEDYEFIIRRSAELEPNWRDFIPSLSFGTKDEFHFFPEDPQLTFAEDKLVPVEPRKKSFYSMHFCMSKLFHFLFFTKGTAGFALGKWFYGLLENREGLAKTCLFGERQIKRLLYDCQECGDCALFNLAYLCPMWECAKCQRNGPCGGSRGGMCEADAEKQCVWVRAYERLGGAGSLDSLKEYLPPVDHSLAKTSSWGNYFLGKDHTGR